MYLSQIMIAGFRQFGTGENAITIPLQKGITAFVGRNDSGKTAIIDALRLALLTRDHEMLRVYPEDFHCNSRGEHEKTIKIHCMFSDLTDEDKGSFLEYLTYNQSGQISLDIHYSVTRLADRPGRGWLNYNTRCGKEGNGSQLEAGAREMLSATYLKPLRDAEREMSAGRNSRLSQVLFNLENINKGEDFSSEILQNIDNEAISKLGLTGLASFFAHYIKTHDGIKEANRTINEDYLKHLSSIHSPLESDINFVSAESATVRLQQVLERLELQGTGCHGRLGLGSNNLLFMGCELLLLSNETEGFPLLLIEEPEAHLHPQRQLRLMQFLKQVTQKQKDHNQAVQVILTTHSPNLASLIPLENIVLITHQNAFSLAPIFTKLDPTDYRFLERFLDVTKANLFFSHGVIIVEGDAEALLLPTIARLLGKDLTAHGVSIVNVGSIGLR